MTRLQRMMLLVALAVAASATATAPTPAQSFEEESDCPRWRIYKFNSDGTVNCACRCGLFEPYCCS